MRSCLSLLVAITVGLTASPVQADDIPWVSDINAAIQLAKQSNRMVLVHFYTDSCPPCRRLEKNVYSQPGIGQQISANFVPVKINAEHNRQLAQQLGVDRWPTDVLLDSSGNKLHKQPCPQDKAKYLGQLAQAVRYLGPARVAPSAPTQIASRPGTSPLATPPATPGLPYAPPATTTASNPYAPPKAPLGATPFNTPGKARDNASVYAPPAQGQRGSTFPVGTNTPSPYEPPSASAQVANNGPNLPPRAQPKPPVAQTQGTSPYLPPTAGPSRPYPTNPPVANAGPNTISAPGPNRQPSAYIPPGASFSQATIPAPPTGPRTAYPGSRPSPNQPVAGYRDPSTYPTPSAPPSPHLEARAPAPVTPPNAPGTPAMRQATSGPTTAPTQRSPFALDGKCPVALAEQHRWIAGDKRFGAVHRGKTYLFAGPEQQRKFMGNPDYYAPAISGYDPVMAFDHGQQVVGSRQHGLTLGDGPTRRVYLFASEETLDRFCNDKIRYQNAVRTAEAGIGPTRR